MRLSFTAVLAIAAASPPIGPRIPAGRSGPDQDARVSVQAASFPIARPWLKSTRNRRGIGESRTTTAEMHAPADTAAVLQSVPAAGEGEAEARQVPSTAASGKSRAPQAVAPCQSYSADTSSMEVLSPSAMPGLTYVDEPLEQVEKMVQHLNPTKVDSTFDAGGTGDALPPQHESEFILGKTSAAVADMVRRIPNLIATEEVREPVKIPGFKWYNTRTYNYAIVHRQQTASGPAFVEFRTDARGQPIDYSPDNPGRPLNVGFATVWQFFTPGKLHMSRFRYLGQQSINRRKTYVLAFAQNPEKKGLRVVIYYPSGECSTPLQGVVWIDQSTFQIVRMQTDLLSPLFDIQLYQLRSVLTYSSVKIAGLKLALWLPRDVETRWETGSQVGEESHRYSHYRLFKAKVKILPGFKRLRK